MPGRRNARGGTGMTGGPTRRSPHAYLLASYVVAQLFANGFAAVGRVRGARARDDPRVEPIASGQAATRIKRRCVFRPAGTGSAAHAYPTPVAASIRAQWCRRPRSHATTTPDTGCELRRSCRPARRSAQADSLNLACLPSPFLAMRALSNATVTPPSRSLIRAM